MQIVDGEPIVRESQHTSSSPSVSATMRALAQHVLPVGAPARPSLKTPSIATGASLQQWPYESIVWDGLAQVLVTPESSELMHDSLPRG